VTRKVVGVFVRFPVLPLPVNGETGKVLITVPLKTHNSSKSYMKFRTKNLYL
jgi:hypothetical protein